MKSKKLTMLGITMCSILLLTAGCGKVAKLKNGKEVVGKIKGYTITTEDLYNELKKQGGPQVFLNLIDNYIANKEIKTDKTAEDYAASQIEAYKTQYEQQGQSFSDALKGAGYKNEAAFKDELILNYKKKKVVEIYLKDELTEEEIQNYYNDNIFGDMTVRHILIKPDVATDASDEDKKKAEEKALKEAKELIKKLDKGEKFEDLAKKYTDDEGTKKDGGLLKDFSKDGVVSEFWDASFKLKDNEYTKEPIKSEYGYHVILRVSQKKKPALKEVKDTIEDTLVSEKISNDSTIEKETWKKIRKKYNLEIEDSEINSGYKSLTK